MSLSEPLPHLGSNIDGVIQLQRPTGDPLLERLPLVVGHNQLELAIVGLVDLVDSADVGVVQCRGGLGFLQEPLLRRLVSRQIRGQQLDRHRALEAGIGGLVDHTHPAAAELRDDLTYNTDFAQVEVDRQQINLDRFSLFFPEKRPFFLENTGIFSVSNVRQVAGGNPAQTELFFSRRIGIGPDGQVIPILAGARMSGKVSDSVSVGLLNMQTEAAPGVAPANNFTVARVFRDLPNSSKIGALFVNRVGTGEQAGAGDHNQTYAVDGRWGIGQNGQIAGFAARTETPGLEGRDHAYNAAWDYNSERWRFTLGLR